MRYLTIQRNKSFVACLMRVKIYIEDPNSTEIKIQNVPCRKIGELKNGEQQTFMIGDEKLRIYVIADKLSKNYCYDFYEVPEGTENIFLSGSCKYNPLNGNAFRFDGVPTEEMKYRRKHGMKKGVLVLIIALIIGIIIGLIMSLAPLFFTPDAKEFTKSGMSITLNEQFSERTYEDSDTAYSSPNIAVFIDEVKYNDDKELTSMTLDEYCQLLIDFNGQISTVKHKGDHLTYYEYSDLSDNGTNYRYLCFVYKTDYSFWLVQFAVAETDYSLYKEDIFTYAESVKFNSSSI